MDLIYTNAQRVDLGILQSYALDLSFGEDGNENDFEIILGKSEPALEDGAFVYIEGTEYGGIVGGMKSNSTDEIRTNFGRTWHGVLNSKIVEPDPGADYFTISGDANECLAVMVARLGLSELFTVSGDLSGIAIKSYKFARYIKGYDALRAMLASAGAKLKMLWTSAGVLLYAEPIVDYTSAPIDGDEAIIKVERYGDKVNHLICLGSGDLAARQVVHLYVDQFGRISETPYYTGIAEIADTYDYSNAKDVEELRSGGVKRLEELRANDKVEVLADDGVSVEYDVGDIIGGTDTYSKNTAKATITQKIVRIDNGAVSIDYKTRR